MDTGVAAGILVASSSSSIVPAVPLSRLASSGLMRRPAPINGTCPLLPASRSPAAEQGSHLRFLHPGRDRSDAVEKDELGALDHGRGQIGSGSAQRRHPIA